MYKNLKLSSWNTKMNSRFNPCFNGSMYKNLFLRALLWRHRYNVSILVLMDLCIKTDYYNPYRLCKVCFNPCFNGSMYKNLRCQLLNSGQINSFNPCFNGSMYKNPGFFLGGWYPVFCFNPCFNGSMYKNLPGCYVFVST